MEEVKKMKRVMFYGPKDIRVEESEIPKAKAGEVIIKNKVTLTCGTDVKTYMRGYRYEPPFPMGHEAAGIVYEVGEGVTTFKVGDRVVAHNSAPCNKCYYCKKGQHSMCVDLFQNQFTNGAYAQYQKIPARIVEQNMFHVPDNMNYKQAALLEPLSCAIYGVDETPFDIGDTVCINGCGPIGLMFVRMCYLRGARVIACDLSETRLEKARILGAAETVNVSETKDQVADVRKLTEDGRGVDAAIEAAGLPEVWNMALNMVRPGGFMLAFGGTKKDQTIAIDTYKMHYEQLTIKGVFHTTPKHVNAAFEMLKMNAISEKDFVQNEYQIEDIEKAILEHASGKVIKNAIIYND
ncbi:alcohol dehydrogenase catalytic domain-containing protein [Tepidanaerobacter syntrophicus]|uniref:alcohol dehydrogenase catalytic domain-containing protein n=1 Tax=Tepidanaerobacter syntrophicus TaxID=224999 RepID=UPI001BD3E834|nr:zinc-binding dehydrogenase [Tepidanaerobacter syntrophicus]